MVTKGIRISDVKNGKCIPLSEILMNIPDVDEYNWAVLWLDVTPFEKAGKEICELEKEIKDTENGIPCSVTFLKKISKKIFQEIEVLIIGCRSKKNLQRYSNDEEMYKSCDITIEMIDGGFWEIFSKNIKWIDQLVANYSEVELLAPDFQNKK